MPGIKLSGIVLFAVLLSATGFSQTTVNRRLVMAEQVAWFPGKDIESPGSLK
jgi:hypothetical protein